MMTECVVLNGDLINIGPWDYQIQRVEITPAEYDKNGELIKEAVYEDQVTNPFPDGATIMQVEIVEGEDGGWYPADHITPETDADKIAILEKDISNYKHQADVIIPEKLDRMDSENLGTMLAVSEVSETTTTKTNSLENENVDTMLGLAETYETILLLQAKIEEFEVRLSQLGGN